MSDPSVTYGMGLAAGMVYLARAWFYPRRPCRACHGDGKYTTTTLTGRDLERACGRCGGTGSRLRLTSRMLGRRQ